MSTDATTPPALQPVERTEERRHLAEVAYRRLAEAFALVEEPQWSSPTPCEGWTVRDLGGHLVGAMRSARSLRETASQMSEVRRRQRRTGEAQVDAMTAVQIERAADLTPQEVAAELHRLVGPATAGRWRMPGPLRRTASLRVVMGTIDERWSLDYLLGTILTRDAWLHRVDLADALGREVDLDADDARIVGDVAAEWARRHGQPVDLVLTGPAGGRLTVGDGEGPLVEVDAVQFCRAVSGRATHPHPLLGVAVPF